MFILSRAGIDAARALTDYNMEEARVKKSATACSRRTVAMLDRSKFDRVYFANVTALDAIHVLITYASTDHPLIRRAEQLGIEVLLVTADDAP